MGLRRGVGWLVILSQVLNNLGLGALLIMLRFGSCHCCVLLSCRAARRLHHRAAALDLKWRFNMQVRRDRGRSPERTEVVRTAAQGANPHQFTVVRKSAVLRYRVCSSDAHHNEVVHEGAGVAFPMTFDGAPEAAHADPTCDRDRASRRCACRPCGQSVRQSPS